MLSLPASVAEAMRWGLFYDFIPDESVQLIGCEAAGHGVDTDETCSNHRQWNIGRISRYEILFLSG